MDLKARPIHHRLAEQVLAHILLCRLAYYVEWHMRQAWAQLMFADTDKAAKAMRRSDREDWQRRMTRQRCKLSSIFG